MQNMKILKFFYVTGVVPDVRRYLKQHLKFHIALKIILANAGGIRMLMNLFDENDSHILK